MNRRTVFGCRLRRTATCSAVRKEEDIDSLLVRIIVFIRLDMEYDVPYKASTAIRRDAETNDDHRARQRCGDRNEAPPARRLARGDGRQALLRGGGAAHPARRARPGRGSGRG